MVDIGTVIALIKGLAPKASGGDIEQAVYDWLNEHPEATTTVQDGSITEAKLAAALAAKITGMGNAIAALTTGSTWEGVQKIVQSGAGAALYPIGTQFRVEDSDNGEILFDVVDHRTVTDPADNTEKPAMFLLMHSVIYSKQFDAIEALFYAEEGLAAGTYHFTIQNYDASYGGDKTYEFTLTQAVPAGGQIVLDWPYNQQLLGRSV